MTVRNRADRPSPGEAFARLVSIMDRLREPGGCPWDREQTFASLRRYLVEEAAEALEALDREDWPHFSEELGDLLLQIVFHGRMGAEAGLFDIVDIVEGISDKMTRRHPHVFGAGHAATAEEVHRNWERLKAAEKGGEQEEHPLGRLPPDLSSLQKAQKTGARAGATGFDWPDAAAVLRKVQEEMGELQAEMDAAPETPERRARMEEELGDVLFALGQLARHLDLDADRALNRGVLKFRDRYARMVRMLEGEGRSLEGMSDEQMEAAWQRAKRLHAQGKSGVGSVLPDEYPGKG